MKISLRWIITFADVSIIITIYEQSSRAILYVKVGIQPPQNEKKSLTLSVTNSAL